MLTLLLTPDKKAVASLFAETPQTIPPISMETTDFRVARVERAAGGTQGQRRYYDPVSSAGWSMRAAIGLGADRIPLAGTYTLTFNGATTSPIVYNADATLVQTRLNALSTIATVGGVVVTQSSPGFFLIAFSVSGTKPAIFGDSTSLAPTSVVENGKFIEGTSARPEVQVLRVVQGPAALNYLTEGSDAPSVTTVTVAGGGSGQNASARFFLDHEPYDGSWTIYFDDVQSQLIDFDAEADAVRAVLEAIPGIGVGKVQVVKEDAGQYLVALKDTLANSAHTFFANGAGLKIISYFYGTLDTKTYGIQMLLGANESAPGFLEVDGTPPSSTATKLLKEPIQLQSAVIDPSSLVPVPFFTTYSATEIAAMLAAISASTTTFLPGITGYTGGGSDKLDGIATVDLTVPRLYSFIHSIEGYRTYVLRAGYDAESSPGYSAIIRPDDFGSLNQKVFQSLE